MKQKTKLLAAVLLLSFHCLAQCLSAPPFPTCTGTEPSVVANDNIGIAQTKYYYGAPVSLSNVRISGGTLVVCRDLTLSELVFDSGVIYVQPYATLIVNNAAGLVVRGNTSIYNSGTFQCMGNFVMDGTYASASRPNIFINTGGLSWFKMPNQYFVINNPYSKLVNNGIADFHGLITDPPAAAGSVCLGNYSQTRMTVLYNKAHDPYIAPLGNACVSVSQYSQFYDTLTIYPNINFCLGAGHTSDASCIPWGCKPNAWGAGQVITGCTNCITVLHALAASFKKIEAAASGDANEINWEMLDNNTKLFYVERSVDGIAFTTIDSVKGNGGDSYRFYDRGFDAIDYYRVIAITGNTRTSSSILQVKRNALPGMVSPNPFNDHLVVSLDGFSTKQVSIIITDISGRKILPGKIIINEKKAHLFFGTLGRGLYVISVIDHNKKQTYKVVRQ